MTLSPCLQGRSFEMKKLSRIAIATALLMFPPAGVLLAQNAPSTDTPATSTPAPATQPTTAPVAEPAATPPTATTTTATDTPTKKKKPAKKMSRRQEIDRSIDSGTVPSRYRSSVPKEYQQYIPFSK
jgi:outer membrane biosynthesis protein TonB